MSKTTKAYASKHELMNVLLNMSNESILVADITARCADQIIDAEGWNQGNRRLEEPLVDKFKRDMDHGEFLDMSDLIVGSEPLDGGFVFRLGDGQHRLNAQARSGKTVKYVIKYYSDPADFAQAVTKVDSGKPRTKADLVKVLGLNDSAFQQYERIVSAMLRFEGKKVGRMSNVEWISYSEKFSKSIKWSLSLPWRQFKAHVLAALVFAHARQKTVTEELVSLTVAGAGLATGSAPLALKNALGVLNDAKNEDAKTRAMVYVLRVLHDAYKGRGVSYSVIKRTKPYADAVQFFAGADAAHRFMGQDKAAA